MSLLKKETFLAQLGNHSDTKTGAVSTPLHLSTIYEHPGLGRSTGYDYTRTANPTRDILQQGLAELENGTDGFVTSSGMSAIQLVLGVFSAGGHIITSRDLYGGSFRYFDDLEKKGILSFTYVNEQEEIEAAIQKNTVAIFIETPTNPLMKETDIAFVSRLAKRRQLLLIVDNTFYTPILQQPLDQGADVVIHSATKYLGGHNDLLAGVVVVKEKELAEKLTFQLNTTGTVLPPFDCWLLIRGLKTLGLRIKQHQSNAKNIAAFLKDIPQVEKIYYPGKGGMLSFTLYCPEQVEPFLKALKIFTFAESLGGVESLITYPVTQTHADIPEEVRESYGLTNTLLRASIGIEHIEDLIGDLRQAFEGI